MITIEVSYESNYVIILNEIVLFWGVVFLYSIYFYLMRSNVFKLYTINLIIGTLFNIEIYD